MNLRLSKWSEADYSTFLDYLKSNADEKYREFNFSLVPTVKKDALLGVRVPKLREIGREISKGNPLDFLNISQSELYEEKMLRGIVTGLIKTQGAKELFRLCDSFVNEIDNWAICDSFCAGLREIKKYRSEFFEHIACYLESGKEFVVRSGLVIMLNHYLDDEYIHRVLKRCDSIHSEAYYIRMAQAWLAATALAKCRDAAMPYFLNNSLDDRTFNKAIQKCIESRRISDADKQLLRGLRKQQHTSNVK